LPTPGEVRNIVHEHDAPEIALHLLEGGFELRGRLQVPYPLVTPLRACQSLRQAAQRAHRVFERRLHLLEQEGGCAVARVQHGIVAHLVLDLGVAFESGVELVEDALAGFGRHGIDGVLRVDQFGTFLQHDVGEACHVLVGRCQEHAFLGLHRVQQVSPGVADHLDALGRTPGDLIDAVVQLRHAVIGEGRRDHGHQNDQAEGRSELHFDCCSHECILESYAMGHLRNETVHFGQALSFLTCRRLLPRARQPRSSE
jgi:hypothetical protein